MKNVIVLFSLLILPLFSIGQNTGMRISQQHLDNKWMMKKMMAPEKIDFQKMVKREESRIEKLETENVKFNKEIEELKGELSISDDSKKIKKAKKIEKLQKEIEENNQQIANSKMFILIYKKE